MKTAKLIEDNLEGFKGHAALYELNVPLEGHQFVICSTANDMFSGIETYIFPATEEGELIDYGELKGSSRGTTIHAQVLRNAGYTIKK